MRLNRDCRKPSPSDETSLTNVVMPVPDALRLSGLRVGGRRVGVMVSHRHAPQPRLSETVAFGRDKSLDRRDARPGCASLIRATSWWAPRWRDGQRFGNP